MDRTAMWLFSALFLGSLPVAAITLIVTVFSPSASSSRAAGLFVILSLTGLLGMVGINILARYAVLKEHDTGGRIVP
ncbi:MAG: hypothetical protein ABR600_09955 [Actinomycetota bacterium]